VILLVVTGLLAVDVATSVTGVADVIKVVGTADRLLVADDSVEIEVGGASGDDSKISF